MKFASCFVFSFTATYRHAVDAFSLRMAADLPPPLRLVAASPPPKSALHLAPPTVSASPIVESIISHSRVESIISHSQIESIISHSQIESRSPAAATKLPRSKPRTLGLLTFDLDDSLYPVGPVLADANDVFVETIATPLSHRTSSIQGSVFARKLVPSLERQ